MNLSQGLLCRSGSVDAKIVGVHSIVDIRITGNNSFFATLIMVGFFSLSGRSSWRSLILAWNDIEFLLPASVSYELLSFKRNSNDII